MRPKEIDRDAIRVISRDGKECGVIIAQLSDYLGEAGRSSRYRVLWPDGSKTICLGKGMELLDNKTYKIR